MPGERRVGLLRLLAEAPLVGAEHARAGALGEREQPRAQRFAVERLDAVEERQQQDGREVRQADDHEREQRAGAPATSGPANVAIRK